MAAKKYLGGKSGAPLSCGRWWQWQWRTPNPFLVGALHLEIPTCQLQPSALGPHIPHMPLMMMRRGGTIDAKLHPVPTLSSWRNGSIDIDYVKQEI